MKKIAFITWISIAVPLCLSAHTYIDSATDSTEENRRRREELFPNIAGKSLMTPTGWGAYNSFVFASIAGTYPQVYSGNKADLAVTGGGGFGNSAKWVSVVGFVAVNDVSAFNNLSANLILSRRIGRGMGISAGGLHMFADPTQTDATASYYVVFSHAVQGLPSFTPGCSRLSYSIGAGSGRFYNKSPRDVQTGKSKHGTGLFANASFEVFKSLNVTAEWTGLNVGFAIGWRPTAFLPAFNLGLTDLTRLSGDKPRLVFTLSYAYYIR